MYVRLVRFALGFGKHAVAQTIADELAPLIASQPGCEDVTVFGDDIDGSVIAAKLEYLREAGHVL